MSNATAQRRLRSERLSGSAEPPLVGVGQPEDRSAAEAGCVMEALGVRRLSGSVSG